MFDDSTCMKESVGSENGIFSMNSVIILTERNNSHFSGISIILPPDQETWQVNNYFSGISIILPPDQETWQVNNYFSRISIILPPDQETWQVVNY